MDSEDDDGATCRAVGSAVRPGRSVNGQTIYLDAASSEGPGHCLAARAPKPGEEPSDVRTTSTPTTVIVTRASGGFGAMTVRAPAGAGHTLYAGMRDTTAETPPR